MMDTKLIRAEGADSAALDDALRQSASILRRGGLVVFPTETVYGLGADATNEDAVKSIFQAKGRPSDNPLIIHIANPADAELYTYTNDMYRKLAECFMPGPLTVVLRARECVPLSVRAGLPTVAVRCPAHPVARRFLQACEVGVAAPSANRSGSPSPTTAQHVLDDMYGKVEVIIDGGACEVGVESTIVKIEDDGSLTLLRPGRITLEDLLAVCDRINIADAVLEKLKDGETVLSPGMKYKHYAPTAPVVLLSAGRARAAEYIDAQKLKFAVLLAYTEDVEYFNQYFADNGCSAHVYDFGPANDEIEQAKRLFAILRDVERFNPDTIYAPLPSKQGMGLALYNRMVRAAGYNIINLRE